MSVYEVHLGSWKRKPEDNNRPLTYRELAVELGNYATEMGYTHIEVLPIAASELGTGRGGPRCMSCPAARDPH